MSRPQSASSTEPSDNAAEFSSAHPSVHVKIFKDGPQRFLAVSAQLDVIAFGATPEEAAAEAFVGDASDHVQRERAKGRSGLIDVSKEEDPEKQLEERLKDLLSDLGLQDELPHSSVDATCG